MHGPPAFREGLNDGKMLRLHSEAKGKAGGLFYETRNDGIVLHGDLVPKTFQKVSKKDFKRFQKGFKRFQKVSKKISKGFKNVSKTFQKRFKKVEKVSKRFKEVSKRVPECF